MRTRPARLPRLETVADVLDDLYTVMPAYMDDETIGRREAILRSHEHDAEPPPKRNFQ